jgi:translocation and assembly module TamB
MGVAALAMLLIVAAITIVQTAWFRAYVKQKIIASTEESTGGKVDVNSFTFDWRHMRAVVTGFVIHGAEPAGAAPFLSAQRIQMDLRLFTSIHHVMDLAYLGIEQPQANVIVLPDGRTNIPNPKQKQASNETPLAHPWQRPESCPLVQRSQPGLSWPAVVSAFVRSFWEKRAG